LINIKSFRVLKMPRIIKGLLFLLGKERNDICSPNSSLLFWKKAKVFIDGEMPRLMKEYRALGAKP